MEVRVRLPAMAQLLSVPNMVVVAAGLEGHLQTLAVHLCMVQAAVLVEEMPLQVEALVVCGVPMILAVVVRLEAVTVMAPQELTVSLAVVMGAAEVVLVVQVVMAEPVVLAVFLAEVPVAGVEQVMAAGQMVLVLAD